MFVYVEVKINIFYANLY